MAESFHIDVEDHNYPSERERAEGFLAKVTNLEYNILIVNLILEIPSAVFDQLSAAHKPKYALVSMLMSYIVLFISALDLVLRGRKARVSLSMKGLIPWFYYSYPNDLKPFGTLLDIMGIVCAILQCVFTSIAYYFLSKNADNPIKVNFWPIIFALGLLYSKFSRNASQSSEPLSQNNEALIPLISRPTEPAEFSLADLTTATDYFFEHNKIGEGYFGDVYLGKLSGGREVVIQSGFSQQDSFDFLRELELLSSLEHENLVGFVGYCQDGAHKLLVFEYTKNGTLRDHLHGQRNSSLINSWKMRIKIALDAARGINYLHNQRVPIIHGCIKSSNILLDANWNARVSDFVLASRGYHMRANDNLIDLAPALVYTDPEYLHSKICQPKNDVYSFGIVLLELLIGKTAIFKDNDNGGRVTRLVNFAVPKILRSELFWVLDTRVSLPQQNEAEALELVASTALHCLYLDGSKRPTMTDVVVNLERSLSLCDGY